MGTFSTYFEDFVALIYPKICVCCGNSLFKHEDQLCSQCILKLPKTKFHKELNNPVKKIFWGKTPVANATAFLFYEKESSVQKILHQLKYRSRKEVGEELGLLFGLDVKKSEIFSSCDLIVPVPLHKSKKRKRGYNQSEYIANGLSEALKIPTHFNNLWRKKATRSQTKKSTYARFENVNEVFGIKQPQQLIGKHILLVDDIVTTGSTLEACATILNQLEGVSVSVGTLAMTK